jgi:hypothetical protein
MAPDLGMKLLTLTVEYLTAAALRDRSDYDVEVRDAKDIAAEYEATLRELTSGDVLNKDVGV